MTIHMARSFLEAKSALIPALTKKVDESIEKFTKNPSAPGLNVEQLHSGWFSFRVNDNVRVIFHKDADRIDLAHVDNHDAAYGWAKRHRFTLGSDGITISEVRYEVETNYT